MKTKTILFLFLLYSAMLSAQVKRVAVLETVDKENKVSYASKLILRTSLSKAIANLPDCEVYDRTDIDAIMSEHTFQRSGLVSNDQIKRLGEMTGAEYILVAEAVKVNAKNLFVTAKLLDVETARTIVTEMMEINMEHMQQGCNALVKKMFPDKKEFDFGTKAVGPQLIRNSKSDQRLFGVGAYSYGETQMDKKAYEAFLRNNAPEVFKRYLRGKACISAGWTMFAIGAAATVAGGVLMIKAESLMYGYWSPEKDNEFSKYWVPGLGLVCGGAGLTFISIPVLSAGHGIVNNTPRRFNKQNMVRADLSLNIQASQNGIGLALSF